MKGLLKNFRFRKLVLGIADAFIVIVAALLSDYVLKGLHHASLTPRQLFISAVYSMVCCAALMFITGAYSKMWRYFSARDYISCLTGSAAGVLIATALIYVTQDYLPPAYIALQVVITALGVCLFRFIFKQTFIEISEVNHDGSRVKRTMVIGAGKAGRTMIREMLGTVRRSKPDQVSYLPICIIDDDTSKTGSYIEGVEVVGTTNEIAKYANQMNIEQIVFAIPSCMEDDRQRILDLCSKTSIPVKVIPFISDLVFKDSNKPELLAQVHDIKVEDLLGRKPVTFDNKDVRDFIHGKVCMVTGGGGSIGSELVRQIAKYEPRQVIIVDIYENNAYEIQQELIMEYGHSLDLVTLIASVRDYYRMNQIIGKYKPDIIFHAAAHKHVPLMEVSPMEAIKNNIVGTFNVASLAHFHNVKKFVMISTDKAVNPTNVMGASKRCCEMIIQYLSQQKEGCTDFVTTRFGNVLGSNGSVIPLFKRQIEQGKPVTVTHPDIIRYFMTIPEAVSLVLESAAFAKGGEIFVLDMGKPVRIVALAENLIRMYGKRPYEDVEIKFTGLRPGEKIREELLMNEEGLQKTDNELIFVGKQIDIDQEKFAEQLFSLTKAAQKNDEQIAINALHKMVPTFTTPEEFNSRAERENAVKV